VREFGVPGPLVGLAGVGLPLLELAISILLLPAATRQAAAIVALVVLLVFCAAIGRAMVRGEAPACHCFGQLHSTPAGWGTLARNAVLAGVAAFVAVGASSDPGPGAFAWLGELGGVAWLVVALGVVLALVLALGGYAVVHVIRSYGRVLVRLEAVEERLRVAGFALEEPDDVPQLGLEPGTPAPSFWLPSVDGPRVALGDLLAPGVPVLLLFTSPSCEPCAKLMPAVAEWQREHADVVTVALLSAGEPERVRADAAEHGLV
jgi:thiol-disulfide isomerase/thioredoxin